MANGHPHPKANPEYWRQRIAELDKKQCKTGAELNAVLQEMVKAHGQLVKASCIELVLAEYSAMVTSMPKDTGRAQAGWQISKAPSESVPPIIKRKNGQTGVLPEFAELIQKNMPDELATLELTTADVIYITNNVEYILALEAGWSVQAPQGFIGKFLNRVKIGLGRLAATL